MFRWKPLLTLTGAALALSVLVVPASAHAHHGSRHTAAQVYCSVCQEDHDRGSCPSYCGDCGYSHTGDCAGHTHSGRGHHGGHC